MATKTLIFNTLVTSSLLSAVGMPAQAAPILIFNTGVVTSGVPQPDNAAELHYSLIAPGVVTGTPFVATSAGGFPIPPWLADSTVSAWIAPSESTEGSAGLHLPHHVRPDRIHSIHCNIEGPVVYRQ